jgi:hypothetical protein
VLSTVKKGGLLSRVLPGRAKRESPEASQSNDFDEHRMQIEQRAAVIEQGFGSIGLRVAQLGTEELVELYFKMFNPGETDIPNLS